MAEWLYERGIGENRAALLEHGRILEALIELPGSTGVGSILPARLLTILVPKRRAIVALEGGGEALLEPLPARLTEGAALRVEIVREALAEAGRDKLPRCRATDEPPRVAPDLEARLRARPTAVSVVTPHGPDLLEQAGWSELLEEARTGEIAFEGGQLRMSLTPAMTLFDVDGALDPPALAAAGASAAAAAIRRMSIGGSIGIDLPTLGSREDRLAAAAAFDALLPQPYERTAVNGFGFLQVVRRRERPSLPELLQADPVGAAARALLRRAERSTGAATLSAHPLVIDRVEAWLPLLEQRIGGRVDLRPDPGLAISAGHVHSRSA